MEFLEGREEKGRRGDETKIQTWKMLGIWVKKNEIFLSFQAGVFIERKLAS